MLQSLHVENYALIDSLELELGSSLNIITGETGAGKSILLGALGLLLGSRADISAIKDNKQSCIVEGSFLVDGYGLEDFFENYDLDYEPICIIRRMIMPSGKSRAFVNELPVQITTLKELGESLIDIHSQHQTRMLQQLSYQLKIIDSLSEDKSKIDDYSSTYQALKQAQNQLSTLTERNDAEKTQADWIEYQFEELDSANLKKGECDQLEQDLKQMTSSEQIIEALLLCANTMENDLGGLLSDLKNIETSFVKLKDSYNKGDEYAQRLRACLEELKDLNNEVTSEMDRVDSDPETLQKVSDRLDLLYSLQQKHRVQDIDELILLRDSYAVKLETISNYSEQISLCEKEIIRLGDKAQKLAEKISKQRKKNAKTIEKHVTESLKNLGMSTAKFEIEFQQAEKLSAAGMDEIRFMFSSVAELKTQPIEKVASGGELSRVMLSLKSIVAQSIKLPTIIFDEIDTGVSGRIADAMGEIITQMGDNMQVINITHLPQVASKGNNHFVVYKESSSTNIKKLDEVQRIDEIAKMLSGNTITSSAIEQARFLLGK